MGATYVASTASTAKLEFVKSCGADDVIDYTQTSIEGAFMEGFDLVFDTIGSATSGVRLLRPGGIIVSTISNPTGESLSEWMRLSGDMANKSTTAQFLNCIGPVMDVFTGAWYMNRKADGRYHFVMVTGDGESMKKIADWVESGKLKAKIDKTYPLAQAIDAMAHLETGHARGKVVIKVTEGEGASA